VLESEDRLREAAAALFQKYKQPVLVEEFLSGREFTLGLLGENRPKVLPPMEIVYTNPDTKFPIYTFEHKLTEHPEVRYDAPAKVDAKLLRELERVARNSFIALGCRDVSRIDLRCGRQRQGVFHRVQSAARPDAGLVGHVPDRHGRRPELPRSDRRDHAPAIGRVRDKQKQNGNSAPKPGAPA